MPANGKLVTQADQLKYKKNAIDLLGLREENPLFKYGQKAEGGVGGDDLRVTVFYQMLVDVDTSTDVDPTKFEAYGATWNATLGAYDAIAGINGNELVRGIKTTPQTIFSRIVRGKRLYAKTMLNVDSAIMKNQKSDIWKRLENKFLAKLKTLADGTLTLDTQGGALTNVGIPSGNKFGSASVKFETDTNLLALREMVSIAKIIGQGRELFFLGGIKLNSLIEVATRFVNTNWADQAGKKGGIANAQEILGGVSIILNTPRIILRDFDTVFPATGAGTNERKFFLITSDCYGFDRSEPKGMLWENEENKSVYFDMELDYVLEITDPNGFYEFKYLDGLPA